MDRKLFNGFCSSLPETTYVTQWRGSQVWKIGYRVFAIENWHRERLGGITFKASETSFEHLKEVKGIRPAPYFASRGLKWVQYYLPDSLPLNVLERYIAKSYLEVSSSLPSKLQRELNLPVQIDRPSASATLLAGATQESR